MDKLREDFEEKYNKRLSAVNRLMQLEQDKTVKEYLSLMKKEEQLKKELFNSYKQLKFHEYENCNHVTVISKYECDRHEGREHILHACIKCGLDESVFEDYGVTLSTEEQVISDYFKCHNPIIKGVSIDVRCEDNDEARLIYKRIIKNNPDIDDESLANLFKMEYDNYIVQKSYAELNAYNSKRRLKTK